MKKTIIFSVILLLLAAAACAQGPSKGFNLYGGAGITFGSGPQEFTDFHKEGYHLMAGLGLNMIPLIQFVGKVEYHTFSKDRDNFFPSASDLEGGTRRIYMFGVDARLGANVPTAPMTPFLFAGIGLARITENDVTTALMIPIEEFESDTDFYVNIGGGVEFKMLRVLNMFVQGKYVNVRQSGDNIVFIPVTLGIKL